MKAVIETFRPVMGYEGLYEISDYGCVRSLKCGKVRYLRNKKDRYGYEGICLYSDGKQKRFRVHRLVYEAFVGEIPAGMEIDHINTVRDDNRLANLRVVTSKENNANPITAARHRESTREANRRKAKDPKWRESVREANKRLSQDPKWIEAHREAAKRRSQDPKWREAVREGTRKARNKPILQLDKQTGVVIREWECAADAWRELGIDQGNISSCCHGKLNSAGGYRWKFA